MDFISFNSNLQLKFHGFDKTLHTDRVILVKHNESPAISALEQASVV